MSSISSAPLCRCGCGQPTRPHTETRRRLRGRPVRQIAGVTYCAYLRGHQPQRRGATAKRAARVAEAQRLVFDEGMSYRDAAAYMEIPYGTMLHYMSDPTGERNRARNAACVARMRERDLDGYRARQAKFSRRSWHRRRQRRSESWLKANELAAWIRRRVDPASLSESSHRALLRWQQSPNNRARIDGVDRLLTEVDIHLSELPEELWT